MSTLFKRPEGTFGFEEFRRDPEDMGGWTPVSYFSARECSSEMAATDSACLLVPWLAPLVHRDSVARRATLPAWPEISPNGSFGTTAARS